MPYRRTRPRRSSRRPLPNLGIGDVLTSTLRAPLEPSPHACLCATRRRRRSSSPRLNRNGRSSTRPYIASLRLRSHSHRAAARTSLPSRRARSRRTAHFLHSSACSPPSALAWPLPADPCLCLWVSLVVDQHARLHRPYPSILDANATAPSYVTLDLVALRPARPCLSRNCSRSCCPSRRVHSSRSSHASSRSP